MRRKQIPISPHSYYRWDVPIKNLLSVRTGILSEIDPTFGNHPILIKTWSDDSITWDFVHGISVNKNSVIKITT
jgi:hypothetical protein